MFRTVADTGNPDRIQAVLLYVFFRGQHHGAFDDVLELSRIAGQRQPAKSIAELRIDRAQPTAGETRVLLHEVSDESIHVVRPLP